jgi:hypothetical protein
MNRGFKKPAQLPPVEHALALDYLSKAHLMDLAWSLAGACATSADDPDAIMSVLRDHSAIVSVYRNDNSLENIETLMAKRKPQSRQMGA